MDRLMINNIINRSASKNFAEEIIKEKRSDISRIAPSFLDKVNKEAKIFIEKSIVDFKKNQKTIR